MAQSDKQYESRFSDTGIDAPAMESIPPEKLITLKGRYFVQKMVTEIYLYTDMEGKMFGQQTFQDLTLLGEMPSEKLIKLIERQRRKHQPKEED